MAMNYVTKRHVWWLISRLVLALVFIPKMQKILFIPFMTSTTMHPLDPWSFWFEHNGTKEAFPYGPVMFAFLWPASIVSKLFSNITGLDIELTSGIFTSITLLIIDYLICRKIDTFVSKQTFWSYASILAPLPLYISYVQGQLDIIPAFLLLVGSQFIRRNSWLKAGVFIGLAISAKFSLILALPFLLLYFIFDIRKISQGRLFISGLLPAGVLTLLPIFWSRGFREMVLGTPEVMKSLNFTLNMGSTKLLILPIAYFAFFLWFWNLGRVTPALLISFQGVALLTVASLQISSIGWYLWGFYIVLIALKNSSPRTLILYQAWQSGIVLFYILYDHNIYFRFWGNVEASIDKTLMDLLFTIIFVVGLTLSVKILNESIKQEDVFGISKKPLAIAIAGDSGVGKDTLAESLSKAVGQEFTTVLHGDDYHLHERGDASWRITTHLDPEANNLDEWSRNFRKSLNREKVVARHYDHSIGRFTLPSATLPNDFVILNGLHSLSLPFSEGVDLKVFLSMEEDLRVNLKIRRDAEARGHQDEKAVLQSIIERKEQYQFFIEPQKIDADLLIHLSQISFEPLRLSVEIRTPNQSLVREIYRVINSLSSVPSKLERKSNGELWLYVETSELTSDENFELLSILVPKYEKLLTEARSLDSGASGFMSVVCLAALASQRNFRYADS